jgi:kynureninase
MSPENNHCRADVAPIALYNAFHEIWTAARNLKEIIDGREYERFSPERKAIP